MHMITSHYHKPTSRNSKKKEAARQKALRRWALKKDADEASSNSVELSTPVSKHSETPNNCVSVSERKLINNVVSFPSTSTDMSENVSNSPSYTFMNNNRWSSLLRNVKCDECDACNLDVVTNRTFGFSANIELVCINCSKHYGETFSSSRGDNQRTFDVNKKICEAFLKCGKGHAAIEQFSMILGAPTLDKKTFSRCLNNLFEERKVVKEDILRTAQNIVRQKHQEVDTSIKDDDVLNITVSYDGTWHKRGHTSLYGIGIVIDVLTGLVVDYEILSKYCAECVTAERDLAKNSAEFLIWYEGHESLCMKNFSGSSNSMEAAAAEILWKRLLPVYIMVITFIYLAPIIGSGPVYHDTIDGFLESCYKNWWTNILFVNNFVNTDQICLPQSWYVACDMQLYIAALIVLLPILRWPWVGLSIATLGVLASVAGTAAMTYFYEYPPTMLFIHPDIEQRLAYWANAYFKPYSHAGPYCIGLIVGYILATHPKLKFSRLTRIIGWSLAIASNMAVLYGVHEWNSGRDPELIETLLYSGLHRIAWTFGVAWIVTNCATGQGGIVNYILSWKVWIPLGRLTYTIYLIHPIVQIAAVGNARMNVQIKHYFVVWIFFGHLMITIGSSFVASMLVEAPFISLEKILLRVIGGKPKSTANGHAPLPSGSTTPKSVDSDEHTDSPRRSEPVSHL